MPTVDLPDYPGVSQIRHQSPGLPYGWPHLPDKIIFWAFLCLSLTFSPLLAQNVNFSFSKSQVRSTVSGALLHLFSHWQRLFLASKRLSRILIVCTSCKISYNVLSHSHIYRGGVGGWGGSLNFRGGRGGEWKRESLQILDLQRLASLLSIALSNVWTP